mmetsp:Transcript_9700/g.39460  ORF Transcript_9700/g.39460 Transcript_9700/m.39460 type:complete len:672 (-) Transcript_9700:88-2103(-)
MATNDAAGGAQMTNPGLPVNSTWLRAQGGPAILLDSANPSDDDLNSRIEAVNDIIEQYNRLRLNDDDLEAQLRELFPRFFDRSFAFVSAPAVPPRMVFVGKTGVGKSTFINSLLKALSTIDHDLMLVGQAGTTAVPCEVSLLPGESRIRVHIDVASEDYIDELLRKLESPSERRTIRPEVEEALQQLLVSFVLVRSRLGDEPLAWIRPPVDVTENIERSTNAWNEYIDPSNGALRAEFRAWLVAYQGDDARRAITQELVDGADLATLVQELSSMTSGFAWPRMIRVTIPLSNLGHQLYAGGIKVLDLPGIRPFKTKAYDGTEVEELAYIDPRIFEEKDIIVLCQSFEATEASIYLKDFLIRAANNTHCTPQRCAFMVLRRGEAAMRRCGKLLPPQIANKMRWTTLMGDLQHGSAVLGYRVPLTFSGTPGFCLDSLNPAELLVFMRQFLGWHLAELEHHAANVLLMAQAVLQGHYLVWLENVGKPAIEQWRQICRTTAPESLPPAAWRSLESFLSGLYPATIDAFNRRRGSYDGANYMDSYQTALQGFFSSSISNDLGAILASEENQPFVRLLLQSQSASAVTLVQDLQHFHDAISGDDVLWVTLRARWGQGCGYTRDIKATLRTWIHGSVAHAAMMQDAEALLSRLSVAALTLSAPTQGRLPLVQWRITPP